METTTPEEKRKSFLIATCIYGVLLLILFFIRFWPPSDAELALLGGGGGGGVEVNFGDTDLGSGADYKSEVLDVKDATKQTQATTTPEEDIIAEDDEADKTDVVIPKNEKPKVVATKPIIKEPKPVVKPKKANSNATSALDNILKGNKGGDGNSNTAGNQGSANGSINSTGYGTGGTGGGTGGGNGTGNGTGTGAGTGSGSGGGNGSGNGLGNGSGYSLSGRKALSKPAPDKCGNDSGIIVVKITVDKNGNTISASPGYKGTENPTSCMLAAAKEAAMLTKWEPSPTGADKQVGTIRYGFSLN
jgi:hypothetical protein